MILGNTDKIRKFDLDNLSALIGTAFNKDDVIAPKTLQIMVDFVQKYSLSIGVVQSNDKVLALIIGHNASMNITSQLDLQPYSASVFYIENSNLSDFRRDQTALINQSLQAIIIANYVDKFLGGVAFINAPESPQTIKIETIEYINKYGIKQAINQNVQTLNSKSNIYCTDENIKRALLVGVGKRNQDIDISLAELEALCLTAGVEVVGKFSQTRKFPDKYTYMGVGKLDELRELIATSHADLIITDDEISGTCKTNLEDELEVQVLDRSMLILDIFARHATSNEGRLQVSLAQLKYSYSRLSAYAKSEGRFGSGGVGMRGPGETKLTLFKRQAKEKIYKAERELNALKSQRELRRQNRKKNSEKIVALVGYTNAGKSTLLNALTKSSVLAENKLFATLDTTTRELYLAKDKKVLLTDTVGFVNKLPHEFINAFSSTLEEVSLADLLIIVVDNSSPYAQTQFDVVQSVLKNLSADKIPQIVVANKCDELSSLNFTASATPLMISAKSNQNLDKLKSFILKALF